jgi:glucose/arabinose dehydrogenase
MTSARRAAAGLLALTLIAACSAPTPSPTAPLATARATILPSMSLPATPDAAPTVAPTASAAPTLAPVSADAPAIALERVAGGLTDPISVATVPDGRLIVNERIGRAIVVDPTTGATDVALDISDRVQAQGERGLLGLALAPGWPRDPAVYIHYSDRDGDTVVSAFATTSIAPLRIDATSEAMLLTVDQPYGNHNGGQLAFGPDGLLYLGLGDGGSGGDPEGNGQNPRTLLGAVLRIDVERAPDDGNDGPAYGIPTDNPFADGSDGAPEVFVTGLRNPWRFSFDRATGALWIADVGQGSWEEVNRLDPVTDAGANLGWNVMEGAHCYGDDGCATDGLLGPVAEYGHDRGCSVTGGYVYRGLEIDGLAGWYLFSDYCSGIMFGVPSDTDGSDLEPRQLLATGRNVSAFGEDADGELYLVDIGSGELSRVVAAD